MGLVDAIGAIFVLAFAAVIIALVSLGGALLMFFWAGRLPVSLRAALATALGIVVLVGPIALISGSEVIVGPLIIGVTLFAIVGFPVAFLAARKLDRRKQDIAPIFE